MNWEDEGTIVSVRPFGESAAIIDVFTAKHGRHAGLVRGGSSRKMTPILQIGNQLTLEWSARLDEHLGTYNVDLLRSRSGILSDRLKTSALSSLAALLCFSLPERQAFASLYLLSHRLLDHLVDDGNWLTRYGLWELRLLEELGFGLDLSACAGSGRADNLIYVSPKSGQAVSGEAGLRYADKLLPLPRFWTNEEDATPKDLLDGLRTTGFFLSQRLAAGLGNRPLPIARERLIARLERHYGS